MKGIAEFRLAGLTARELIPNRWDLIAFPLVFGLFALAGLGAHQSLAPIATLNQASISLNPIYLPEYALRTTLRMLSALVVSLVFTFVYGTLAAKSRRAEVVLVPLLDILQSIPVLGYIPFIVHVFLSDVSGTRRRRRSGRRLRDLHGASLEHDVQLLSVAAHGAARSRRSDPRFSLQRMAQILAAGSPLRHARPHLEHDDEHVGQLVLHRRRRKPSRSATRRSSCRVSAPIWRRPSNREISAPSAGSSSP